MRTDTPVPLAGRTTVPRPLFQDPCPAGFPSPASDYIERPLDLNDYVISDAPATYYVRAEGRSEMRAGIWSGDLLVVNAALEARDGDIVVACIDGEHTVKRFCRRSGEVWLSPDPLPEEAHLYADIRFQGGEDVTVFGVVTHVVRTLRGQR